MDNALALALPAAWRRPPRCGCAAGSECVEGSLGCTWTLMRGFRVLGMMQWCWLAAWRPHCSAGARPLEHAVLGSMGGLAWLCLAALDRLPDSATRAQ